jgi:hypothetical protein
MWEGWGREKFERGSPPSSPFPKGLEGCLVRQYLGADTTKSVNVLTGSPLEESSSFIEGSTPSPSGPF